MNTITTAFDKSDYEIYSDYLNIKIDGEWLDDKLDAIYPGAGYKGLVPTLLFWMELEEESKIVWNRILPAINQKTICPILMCPDENDFSCTLIMAEIETFEHTVSWNKLGLDNTINYDLEDMGFVVEWFDKVFPFCFSRRAYEQTIKIFRDQLEIDNINYLKKVKAIADLADRKPQ